MEQHRQIHIQKRTQEEQEGFSRATNLDKATLEAMGYDPDERWPEPIPFERDETPDFPIQAMPPILGEMVYYLSESTQTPQEMAGLLSLGILSTAFQKRYTIRVTDDWSEPLCLYLAAVADPGERKSAVLGALMRPVYEFERARQEAEKYELAREKRERELAQAELDNARKNLFHAANPVEAKRRVLELSDRLTGMEERFPCRLLADDSTQEKLIELMRQQGGCLTVCSTEGGVFDIMRGRYERGLNLDVYLKSHAGDPLTVDRLGRDGSHIASPRLSMVLTIQPEVLKEVMESRTFRGRGLCARFLFAICRSKVGQRLVDPDSVPAQVTEKYAAFVRTILAGTGTGELRLSEEADRLRRELQADVEWKLDSDWFRMRDWAGKLVGATVRIAGLIHCADCAYAGDEAADTPVSEQEFLAATWLAKYLAANAEQVYRLRRCDELEDSARYVWERLRRCRFRTEYGLSELTPMLKGRLPTGDERREALDLLCRMGYLREELRTDTGGRSGLSFRINPKTLEL